MKQLPTYLLFLFVAGFPATSFCQDWLKAEQADVPAPSLSMDQEPSAKPAVPAAALPKTSKALPKPGSSKSVVPIPAVASKPVPSKKTLSGPEVSARAQPPDHESLLVEDLDSLLEEHPATGLVANPASKAVSPVLAPSAALPPSGAPVANPGVTPVQPVPGKASVAAAPNPPAPIPVEVPTSPVVDEVNSALPPVSVSDLSLEDPSVPVKLDSEDVSATKVPAESTSNSLVEVPPVVEPVPPSVPVPGKVLLESKSDAAQVSSVPLAPPAVSAPASVPGGVLSSPAGVAKVDSLLSGLADGGMEDSSPTPETVSFDSRVTELKSDPVSPPVAQAAPAKAGEPVKEGTLLERLKRISSSAPVAPEPLKVPVVSVPAPSVSGPVVPADNGPVEVYELVEAEEPPPITWRAPAYKDTSRGGTQLNYYRSTRPVYNGGVYHP